MLGMSSHRGQIHFPFGAAFSPTQAKWNHVIVQSILSQTTFIRQILVDYKGSILRPPLQATYQKHREEI